MQLKNGSKVILLPRDKWKIEDKAKDGYPIYASDKNEIFGLGKVCKIEYLEKKTYYIKGKKILNLFSFRIEHQEKKSPYLIWDFMVETIDDL